MYKIGITGSIGTGKTSIANIFALFNIPIFDADKEVKKILATKKIKEKLKNTWPTIIKNNNIDKLKLRSIIFSNRNEKIKLERLIYPYLQIEKDKFENENYNKKILVYDIPLIYETKSEKNYNLIILANCDPNIQRRRVLDRDKISVSLYRKIIKSQLSYNEKLKFKPETINTNYPKLIIFISVIILLIKILIIIKIKNVGREKINT